MQNQIFLENEHVKASFQLKGAELSSFFHKKNELEYIWQAKPEWWPRHAPVLFPIVGKLKGNSYQFDDKTYQLSQHGFARDMEFNLESRSEDELMFSLLFNDETLQVYPFRFKFVICYKLKGNTLKITYEVHNLEDAPIYFSVGGHPGFICPLKGEEKFEDYYLEFSEQESLDRQLLSDGLFNGETERLMDNDSNLLPLKYAYFEKDAIVLKNFNSDKLLLKSSKGSHGVEVSVPGFPYLGIWTKETGAPFICIEPWYGLADAVNASGDITEKEGIVQLQEGEEFDCEYQISIF